MLSRQATIAIIATIYILQNGLLHVYYRGGSSCTEPDIAGGQSQNTPNLRTVNKTAPREILSYPESMKRLQAAMGESLYRFDRTIRLPLMRVTPEQQSRKFRIDEARKWLRQQRLVVASVVRNAMSGLEPALAILKELSGLFKSTTAVFVENDSADDTREFLYKRAALSTDKFRVILLGCSMVNSVLPCYLNISYASSGHVHRPGHWEQAKRTLAEESTDRGMVMAALRNIYLQFIYDQVSADLLLVLESDLKWDNWDMDLIAQGLFHFKAKRQLDSLCALALLVKDVHDPCTLIFHHNKYYYADSAETESPFTNRIGLMSKIFTKHLDISRAKPEDVPKQPVKVASCFQGAAFYRLSSLRAASAFYAYSEGEWQCEHSTLSRQLRENYLDTQMVVTQSKPQIAG